MSVHAAKGKTKYDSMSIKNLEKLYLESKKAYYNGDAFITDDEFDTLEAILMKKCPKSPVLKITGAQIDGEAVKLPYWMGSLDKMYPEDTKAFQRWITHNKISQEKSKKDIVISVKLDGVSGMLELEHGKEPKLYSRGNGSEGSDWSHNIKYITSIHPGIKEFYSLKKNNYKRLLIRGEFIISRDDFEKNGTYSTSRAMVNGLLGSKTKKTQLMKLIQFVCYEVVDPFPLSPIQQLQLLQPYGFFTVANLPKTPSTILSNNFTFSDLEKYYLDWRKNCIFDMDGVVVFLNTTYERILKGNPKYAFAFKMKVDDQSATTSVLDVEWNISHHGYIKPTVILEKVKINGTNISRATGFHAKFIRDNKVGKGAKVIIIKSGDVIPKIEKVIKASPFGAHLPDLKNCVWNETKTDLKVKNPENEDTYILKQLVHFFSTLKIKHVSGKTLQKFMEHQYSEPLQILLLKKEDISHFDGLGETSASNIVKEMNSKAKAALPLEWIIAGNVFGRNFGKSRLSLIFEELPFLLDESISFQEYNLNAIEEKLLSIAGIQKKTAGMFIKNLKVFSEYWKRVVHQYPHLKKVIKQSSKSVDKSLPLSNYRFLLTGFRDDQIIKEIEEMGGIIENGWKKNINVLIRKDSNYTNSKIDKANKTNCFIVTMDDWKQNIKKKEFISWIIKNTTN